MIKGRTPIVAGGPFLCLLLASCGSGDNAPTPQQNRQLANADVLLNAAPESLSNIDQNALGPTPVENNSDEAGQ